MLQSDCFWTLGIGSTESKYSRTVSVSWEDNTVWGMETSGQLEFADLNTGGDGDVERKREGGRNYKVWGKNWKWIGEIVPESHKGLVVVCFPAVRVEGPCTHQMKSLEACCFSSGAKPFFRMGFSDSPLERLRVSIKRIKFISSNLTAQHFKET